MSNMHVYEQKTKPNELQHDKITKVACADSEESSLSA